MKLKLQMVRITTVFTVKSFYAAVQVYFLESKKYILYKRVRLTCAVNERKNMNIEDLY